MFVPRAVNRKPPAKKPVKRPAATEVNSETNPSSSEVQKKCKVARHEHDEGVKLELPSAHVTDTDIPHTPVEGGMSRECTKLKCHSTTTILRISNESKDGASPSKTAENVTDETRTIKERSRSDEVQIDRNTSGCAQSSGICEKQKRSREEDDREEGPKGRREEDDKEDDPTGSREEDNKEEEPIVSFSKNQRWPEPNEPVCVVCGRYGEYICSKTDVDVCSLECKARNLARSIDKQTARSSLMELTGIPGLPLSASSSSLAAELEGESSSQVEVLPPIPAQPVGYTYNEHEDISDLNMEQIQELRAQVEIFVEGVDIPRPIVEFSHLGMPKSMNSNLETAGYINPTPVQMQVIPAALRNRDLMVCAQTSSGKTASFLVPTILRLHDDVSQSKEYSNPLAVILTPTRELAMQIEDQAKQLMKGLPNMKTALLVGGLPLPPQLHRLRQGVQLIIATPGRLMEIIQKNGVSLQSVKILIIDEFDTMLHMGFQQQVMDIVIHLPEPHQTLLFSATIPKSREQVASSLLGNPVYISIGTPSTPCASVKQIVMWVEEPSKKKKLFAILQDSRHYRPPIVVFVDSKLGADLLAEAIEKVCEISAVSLHGDKPQTERTTILQGFLSGEHPVIVCTGVLGRGIDLPGVTMVINFDMPSSVEEYIHQIGRTGRLGSKGTAVTFINNGAKHLFLEFVNTLKPLGIQLPLQLVNSQHLHNQRQKHTSRKAQQTKERKTHSAGYFTRKQRETNWDSVGELLAKRKRKNKL